MKVAYIVRSTLFTVIGGDTHQVVNTAALIRQLGTEVDILPANQRIDYNRYTLLHFFNLTRPADILPHIGHLTTPYVISPILVNYSLFDKTYRGGIIGRISRHLPQNTIEYLKVVARWLNRTDRSISAAYLLKGQQKSIELILKKCAFLLPNSMLEQNALRQQYKVRNQFAIVPNGVSPALFKPEQDAIKDPNLVLCVARIEGIKNQLNLIKAINNSSYRLLLIGDPAPNQQAYYNTCKEIAGPNITFIDHLPQAELIKYYQQATVHVLPSWFETCGLSSLEAATMGCNIVITDKGYTREYFEDYAFYCDPNSPDSIRNAIHLAATAPSPAALQEKIITHYTWHKAAEKTLSAYRQVLNIA